MAESKPSRARQSVADMVRSMALVVGVVGVIVVATVFLGRDPVLDVDYGSTLASARSSAPYDVLAPEGVDGFRATSVRFTSDDGVTVWHLGFATPDDTYIGVDQTDGDAADFIAGLTDGATPAGSDVTIDGVPWTPYAGGGDPDDEVSALVREVDGSTVLVSGTADLAALEDFAATLESS